MTKMAATTFYGKNPSQIFFSGTTSYTWSQESLLIQNYQYDKNKQNN